MKGSSLAAGSVAARQVVLCQNHVSSTCRSPRQVCFVCQIGIELTDARNAVYSRATSSFEQPAAIRWSELNFPPCLNLVHFDLTELPRNVSESDVLRTALGGV